MMLHSDSETGKRRFVHTLVENSPRKVAWDFYTALKVRLMKFGNFSGLCLWRKPKEHVSGREGAMKQI